MKAVRRKKEVSPTLKRAHSEYQPFTESSANNRDSERIRQKVAERAYLIWEKKGRPNNTELENWVQAEREISTR